MMQLLVLVLASDLAEPWKTAAGVCVDEAVAGVSLLQSRVFMRHLPPTAPPEPEDPTVARARAALLEHAELLEALLHKATHATDGARHDRNQIRNIFHGARHDRNQSLELVAEAPPVVHTEHTELVAARKRMTKAGAKCKRPCQNGGLCFEGLCYCRGSYIGSACQRHALHFVDKRVAYGTSALLALLASLCLWRYAHPFNAARALDAQQLTKDVPGHMADEEYRRPDEAEAEPRGFFVSKLSQLVEYFEDSSSSSASSASGSKA